MHILASMLIPKKKNSLWVLLYLNLLLISWSLFSFYPKLWFLPIYLLAVDFQNIPLLTLSTEGSEVSIWIQNSSQWCWAVSLHPWQFFFLLLRKTSSKFFFLSNSFDQDGTTLTLVSHLHILTGKLNNHLQVPHIFTHWQF